jgi:hypothetical protein
VDRSRVDVVSYNTAVRRITGQRRRDRADEDFTAFLLFIEGDSRFSRMSHDVFFVVDPNFSSASGDLLEPAAWLIWKRSHGFHPPEIARLEELFQSWATERRPRLKKKFKKTD